MDSAKQIEHRAAAWLTRRDSGEWTETDEAGLRAWLEEATAHRIAYLRLEMVWSQSQRLKAYAAGLPPGSGERSDWTIPFFDSRQLMAGGDREVLSADAKDRTPDVVEQEKGTTRVGRGRVRVLAVAASVLLAAGVSYFGYRWYTGDPYATQVGVVASMSLQDGSNITLNTASKVRVDLNSRERHIELAQGEAFFAVAKDATRPFVVTAGTKRIVAVGTQFSVRRREDDVRVVVTEGKVRVDGVPGKPGEVLLAAGAIANIREDSVLLQKRAIAQTEEVLSWRTGYLSFRDTPLDQAIQEFNQYNRQKMVAGDSAVASIPLTGKFKATNYDAFVRLLEDGYGIRAQREGERITLSR